MYTSPPPSSREELLARAERLRGHPLRAIAEALVMPVPSDLRGHKGWIGQVLEAALGATASSRAEPDFPHLGIELKTIPVDEAGVPRESTYVCTAPLDGRLESSWDEAWVRRKLSCVLWVRIEGQGAPGERRVGPSSLWSPSEAEEAVLRADWESFREVIGLGELWQISARGGRALQLRPKAQRASDTVWVQDAEAEWVQATPLGFYLRRSFTRKVL